MSIWRWPLLPHRVDPAFQISLGEGDTPLVRSRAIGPALGLSQLYFKLDYANPSGSYKDRFAAAAVSHMLAAGKTKCIATSSGNTGAALAAFCAAARIECRIAIVEGAPEGKLKQMLAYGARLARIRDFGTDPTVSQRVFAHLQQLGQRPDWALQISAFVYCPQGMAGVQTVGYEISEQMEGRTDHVFCPAGSGGLCVAVARAFAQLAEHRDIEQPPAVHCVQPDGNDTIATPLRRGDAHASSVQCTSRVSGLQVANVIDGQLALEECRQSGGTGHAVSDHFIWETQRSLARTEGLFTEPAGAAAVAGLIQAARAGEIDSDARIVCILSGSGFKDGDSVNNMIQDVPCELLSANQLDAW